MIDGWGMVKVGSGSMVTVGRIVITVVEGRVVGGLVTSVGCGIVVPVVGGMVGTDDEVVVPVVNEGETTVEVVVLVEGGAWAVVDGLVGGLSAVARTGWIWAIPASGERPSTTASGFADWVTPSSTDRSSSSPLTTLLATGSSEGLMARIGWRRARNAARARTAPPRTATRDWRCRRVMVKRASNTSW